jgi:hypothetical protein
MEELIKIQGELKAPKNQFNGFGKYKYRSCEDILEAVKPLLLTHNCILTLSDVVKEVPNLPYIEVTATFANSAGQAISVTATAGIDVNKKGMDVSQCFGTSSSYARKYALNGLFLIDDTKDADTAPPPAEKPKLAPTTANWAKAVAAMKSGAVTNEFVKSNYSITQEDLEKLQDESI